jgi:hypothetical protein
MEAYHQAAMHRSAVRGRIVAGCVLTALGLAFSFSLWPIGYLGGASETFSASAHFGPWMIPGFAFLFTGIGLLVAGWAGGGALQAWGFGVAGFGLGMSLGLWPIGFIAGVQREFDLTLHVGPWMLGGFIPLFIGLALILADLALHPRYRPPTNGLSDDDFANGATLASPVEG